MEVSEAQREVRAVFRGGLVGQCVSATLWLASALLATVSTPRRAILVLVVGGSAHRLDWFYPAFMIALGAHYLPFAFLYGMRLFWALGFGLVSLGVLLAHHPLGFAGAAWVTSWLLMVFGVIGGMQAARER
jgi:hypothetical protein